jgi:hypothetical protein
MTNYAKGGNVKSCSYAKGGVVLGRRRDFMKEPDPFSDGAVGPNAADSQFRKMTPKGGSPQEYTKSGKTSGPHKDKSLPTVTPRQ